MNVDVPELLEALEIQFERRGHELWAPCPLHEERTPSWQILDREDDEKNGFWRCFGCKSGGGAVKLVVELVDEVATGKEAFRWLRARGLVSGFAGALPEQASVEIVDQRTRSEFLLGQEVRFGPLATWPTPPRRYAEGRGITAEQVERWGIGYAIDGRQRGRVVFVARDAKGRPLRVNGRNYAGSNAKYLGPDRGQTFDRTAVFGEQFWPPFAERTKCVVTEGEINALAVERVVGGAIAALSGSEMNTGHVAKLSSFPELLVVSDPDAAGDDLWEALYGALARWAKLRRARLHGGDAQDLEARGELRAALMVTEEG